MFTALEHDIQPYSTVELRNQSSDYIHIQQSMCQFNMSLSDTHKKTTAH